MTSNTAPDVARLVIEELRPVCAGIVNHDLQFSAIAFHPHAEASCPGAASGLNLRFSSHCPIRTYTSCHAVDGRFDRQFVTSPEELDAAAHAMLGGVHGWIRVVLPVVFAMRVYDLVASDFDFASESSTDETHDDALH
jgi:hypothetical protein